MKRGIRAAPGGDGGEAQGLAPRGRLLMPLGDERGGAQILTLVERRDSGGDLLRTPLGDARFVPLLGEHGFDA